MAKIEQQQEDKITELPTELKQHILSLLPTRDAVAASCVSTVWRNTWVSLTAFDFTPNFANPSSTLTQTILNGLDKSDRLYDAVQGSVDGQNCGSLNHNAACWILLLDRVLRVYIKNRQPQQVLKKLCLYMHLRYITDDNIRDFGLDVVSRWLSLVKDDIEELRYHVFTSECCDVILQCKRLTKLELMGCSLTYVDQLIASPCFRLPCLKQLTMLKMSVVGNKTLDFLLHKCLALEELELNEINCVKALRIPEFSKLKKVKIANIHDRLDQVEINAMSLRVLVLVNIKTNLGEVKVSSHSRKNLEELFIDGCTISDGFFNHIVEFPHLKKLSVIYCPLLKHIKIKSDCLASFRIKHCSNLRQLELDAPKLASFEYSSNSNNDFVSLLSKCHADHVSLCFGPRNVTYDSISLQSKLVALLANFKSSKCVSITIFHKKDLIITQDLRESFSPPFCEVQDLSLSVGTRARTHDVLQYLDNLLWLSLQPRKISLECKNQSTLSVELQWRSCKCRRPILKEFRIVDVYRLDDAVVASIEKLLDDTRKVIDDV